MQETYYTNVEHISKDHKIVKLTMQDEGEAPNTNPSPMRQPQSATPPPPHRDEEDEVQCDDDDAVKTFCTEGTPAYTPYLGSRATSLSDLRDLEHDNNGESPPGKGLMFGAAQQKKKVRMKRERGYTFNFDGSNALEQLHFY